MVTHLSCFLCGREYPADEIAGLCECGRPLRVNHEFSMRKEDLAGREASMWRYREALPECEPVTLGEGMTPVFECDSLGENWWVKDEGVNPTGSFKSRGMSMAVSMAQRFGITKVAVPTAGNAGGALSAYGAKAGMEVTVYMPKDTPQAFVEECQMFGAELVLFDGLIHECAAEIARLKEERGWFDMSTLKEPYRIEGKKTMGYEIAEQFEWELPDVILYPTGGGTGLIGMWKAFGEMEKLGWIGPKRPRMVSVQAEGCSVLKPALDSGERFAEPVQGAHTVASGLRVPKAVGDFIMIDLIRESGGTIVTVDDRTMVEAAWEMAENTGIYASPEGGAVLAAAKTLRDSGWIREGERVLMMNTGSGVKYAEALRR